MADKTSFSAYQGSGFNSASGVSPLQEQASKIPTTDEELRAQAERQYEDTYKTLDESYSKQLNALITSQATDEKLLNEQYNNSVSSMLAQLQKRGLHVTASLPEAQTAALNQHRNEVMAFRQGLYNVQRKLPEAQKQLLQDNYDLEIQRRMAANRSTNVPQLSDLLGKIADLQSASFNDYINYLLAKKAKSSGGGGGGGRSGYYRSSGSNKNSTSSGGYVNPNTLKGSAKTYSVEYDPVEAMWQRHNNPPTSQAKKSTSSNKSLYLDQYKNKKK